MSNTGDLIQSISKVRHIFFYEGQEGEQSYSSILSLTSALHLDEWSTSRPRSFTLGNGPVPIVKEARWAPGPVWTNAENIAPIGIRSPQRVAKPTTLSRPAKTHTHTHTHTHTQIHINVIQLQEPITQSIAHTSTTLFFPPMYGVCFVTVTEKYLEFWRQQAYNASMNCLFWGSSSVPKTNINFRKMDVFPSSVEREWKNLSISGSRSFLCDQTHKLLPPAPASED